MGLNKITLFFVLPLLLAAEELALLLLLEVVVIFCCVDPPAALLERLVEVTPAVDDCPAIVELVGNSNEASCYAIADRRPDKLLV